MLIVSGPFVVWASRPAPSHRLPVSEMLSGPLVVRALTSPAKPRSASGPLLVRTSRLPVTRSTETGPLRVSRRRSDRRGTIATRDAFHWASSSLRGPSTVTVPPLIVVRTCDASCRASVSVRAWARIRVRTTRLSRSHPVAEMPPFRRPSIETELPAEIRARVSLTSQKTSRRSYLSPRSSRQFSSHTASEDPCAMAPAGARSTMPARVRRIEADVGMVLVSLIVDAGSDIHL